MKSVKSKWKQYLSIFTVLALILCMLPNQHVFASEASASGSSKLLKNTAFVDQDVDVSLKVTGKSGLGNVVPSDIVLILDRSGSMASKINSLKTAASSFVDKISTSVHRIGFVNFASDVDTVDFTTDKSEIKNAIQSMKAYGGTETASAINSAVTMLKGNRRTDAKPVIVILTDGEFDVASAAAAAKIAVDNDFTFYTIALLDNKDNASIVGTNEYKIDQQLKSMATSARYHYSVGVETLSQAYSDIASEVGQENPYNLVVQQTLNENFEFVDGSADSNIPKPVINGQTITWQMKELSGQETFNYKIRAKSGTKAGEYSDAITGSIYYETYGGNSKTVKIPTNSITLLDTDLDILSYSPNESEVGKSVKVMVRGKDFEYKDDFYVTVGGKKVNISNATSTTFAFKTPAELTTGTYDILAYNSATPQKIGTFTYTEPSKQENLLNVTSIVPDSGNEGKRNYAWVNGKDMKFESEFKVMLGDKEISCSNFSTNKFKLKIPETIAAGTYEVVVYNGKDATGQVIGQYTVNKKTPEVHNLSVTKIDPPSGEEGKQTIIWVHGDNMSRESEFKVEIGGIEVSVSNFTSSKFKIKSPTTLTPGTYDVVVYNGTGAIGQKIGTYEVIKKAPVVHNLNVSKIEPARGEVGELVSMWVKGSGMVRESEFKVEIGGIEVPVSNFSSSRFKIKSPTTLTAGTYDVVVYNGAGATGQIIGTYTVTDKVAVTKIMNINNVTANGKTGTNVYVWITGKNLEYENDFIVKVGNVQVNASNRSTTKFKIRVPSSLAKGTYNIVVYNGTGATGQTIGTYTAE